MSSSLNTSALEAKHFLQDGYFYAEANGLKAHIEIDTSVTGALSEDFNHPLVIIALPGFTVRFQSTSVVSHTKNVYLDTRHCLYRTSVDSNYHRTN
jgi:hypothetical protein